MGLLDKLWDDVVAGPQPDKGLKKLRADRTSGTDVFPDDVDEMTKVMLEHRRRSAEFHHSQSEARRVSQSITINKPPMLRNLDTDSPLPSPGSFGASPPVSPSVASPSMSREKDNMWRSVFHQGGNRARMERVGAEKFDKPLPNSPTVYDWVVINSLDM